ncbi:Pleckstrin y domain-containing family M member 2 [Portunus trituberculatus]|uniref:Pleckstrin y domain-containing family M member 2 n=1 Tax=Portunus trituberculatus TaxID=210409 RepID=A0A5B7D2Y9_PORTR|nr:Pleckstrin y domain-containing family M member 2 [Portunus trituberculatus]
MTTIRGGVKDRIIHEIGRAIKQAQLEWCGVGCVRACTGRWLVLSLDAALLHGLRSLGHGYWPVVSTLLDRPSLSTITSLPYATKPLTRGRSWICLCLNEGQLENYIHVLTSHTGLLAAHYEAHGLLRDPHRAHLLLMLAAGLEHLKFAIPMLSVEEEAPVSYPRCEDLDTSIHIEHIPKVSRRKRQSRSSSQNSSAGTTPITSTPASSEKKKENEHHRSTGGSLCGEASVPLDDRTEAPQSGGENCDNYCKEGDSAARNKENTKGCSRLMADNVETQGCREKFVTVNDTRSSCVETKSTEESKCGQQENDYTGVEPKVVLRQNVSSTKNSEKRVSFTDTLETESNNKTMHKRLSLCSSSGRGMEIRDLSDLKELLSSLKVQGMLPMTLPVLSERAPPEGQEDPPLHQSITSLFQNNNNNNSVSDDSNNNNASDVPTGESLDSEQEKKATQETDPQVGCFSHHSDIIDGVRWEELTKIGQEMLKEGFHEDGKIGKEELISRIYQDYKAGDTQRPTGTRPKRRQDYLNQSDIQTWQTGSKNSSLQRFPKRRGCYSKIHHSNLADRRQLYKQFYKEEKRWPSLHIPAKVDPSAFKEEEERLALEVAQGQSNLTLPGTQMFSLREGHSTGQNVGVQVVLSSHALYVVAPLPRGAKPRHTLKYADIHTIIVGANDLWVCVLSKEAMREDFSVTGAFPGVQLEVGDPDVTHSLMNSLELAIRRHFLSGKLGMRPVPAPPLEKDLKPSTRKGFLQEFTRECVDNFSNSLLEESLLNAWDSRKTVDVSQESSESSEASPAVTPGSAHSSQESTDASQLSTDISDMSNDSSQSEASHTSGELSRASSDASQVSNDISHLSSDVILGSTDSSRHASDLSNSLSDETPTSSDMVQSLSSISDASLNMSQTSGHEEPESCNTSQRSGGTIKGSTGMEHTHPVELELQKQNRFYSFAGGYSRWNGAYLEQSLPAVVVHPAWELSGLSRWLKSRLRLQESPEVVGYWLVDWEDGSSLGGGDSVYGPLGPTKEGSLMFKPPGLLMPWRPAYFILKAGVLYQFNDARERLPHMIVEVVQCVGCVRLSSSQRPHAFQLLRKKEAPLMLAASDEHQASLWLQAFLTIINSGVRDISERTQMPCRVVLLESGVLLAQQSDLFLGPPPQLDSNSSEKDNSGTTSQQLVDASSSSQAPQVQLPLEKKEPEKLKNMHLLHLKERKPLSSSLSSLNHVSGTSSVPGSPVRRISRGEKCLSPARKSLHLRQNSLSRLLDLETASEKQHNIEKPSPPSPQRKLSIQNIPVEKMREEENPHNTESFRYTGEVKVLTISALEHLSSVSIYAECPTTCLLEFECSEAGEISGDWAIYFRSGGQLQQFLASLANTWQSCSEVEFPLRRVEDAGVQQFLLEGSQISSNGWSLLHL